MSKNKYNAVMPTNEKLAKAAKLQQLLLGLEQNELELLFDDERIHKKRYVE